MKEERSGSRNSELWYRHRWPGLNLWNTHLGRVLSQCFRMAAELLGNVHVYRLVIPTMTGNGFISFVQNEGLVLDDCSVEMAWKEEGRLVCLIPCCRLLTLCLGFWNKGGRTLSNVARALNGNPCSGLFSVSLEEVLMGSQTVSAKLLYLRVLVLCKTPPSTASGFLSTEEVLHSLANQWL